MLHKTRGIVFRYTKYGDTSIIVTIFTELFGLQSYIVNGARSKTSKGKIALYQPLTLLDLVVYHKENANILRIKEVQCNYHYHSLAQDIKKSAVAMFLAEVLNKSVKEQSHPEELFQFFFESFQSLDNFSVNYENFHLIFLIGLSRLLGFGPQHAHEILDGRLLDGEENILLQECITSNYGTLLLITNAQRRNILDVLIRFYVNHIDNFGEIRSVQVLRDVLE